MRGPRAALALVALLVGCVSTPPAPERPRTVATLPPRAADPVTWVAPPPARPERPTPQAPALPRVPWLAPSGDGEVAPPSLVQPMVALGAPRLLPLPEIRPLPIRLSPASRSVVAQQVVPPGASVPTPTPPKTPTKAASAEPKAKAPVPAAPQPAPAPKATPPATRAASSNLLPDTPTEDPDFRWEDVNAVAGDTVTLHFNKTNWLYLDAPGQQKTLGFQSITRDKDATTFQFRPLVPGQYVLEFQRQDLANQTSEGKKVNLTVVAPGTRTATTGTPLAPQTTTSVNDALEAARQLVAAGRSAEAVQRLLQASKAEDARVNLELARLLSQDGQDAEALGYLEKNLQLPGPEVPTLELGTRLAALKDPQNRLPAYVKLWLAGTNTPPEDLYLQVFEALRTQKMTAQVQSWAAQYPLWYPAPRLKDRYLYQWGQFLEEPGEARDVRGAWRAYDEVVRLYPLSPHWKAAGERAAYINRHFLQVR